MKEIKLPELAVRSVYYDCYHAKVAFSAFAKQKTSLNSNNLGLSYLLIFSPSHERFSF